MAPATRLVVVGGSAGALDPLLAIVSGLPRELATPLAVVVHMSTQLPSRLVQVLATAAARPVVEPDDKVAIARGHIYIAPPNYHLLVERDGTFALSIDAPVAYSRPAIDVLFESAASALGAGVTGVVLSGANDDGAAGLARIVAAGGRAYVQDPATAAHPTMPRAALRAVPTARSFPIAQLVTSLAAQEVPP